MQIDPNVLANIEKFIALAKKYPGEFDRERQTPKRNPDMYRYDIKKGARRYVYVRAGDITDFFVDAQTGLIYDTLRRRCLRHGNIAGLVDEKDWKKGRIETDRNCVPVLKRKEKPCSICGRTKNVRATALGNRCQYCRGADSRHIGIIRQLGGTPTIGGRPLGTYLKNG